jgi:glycosyltransferase involved in cell wall biosynthesis
MTTTLRFIVDQLIAPVPGPIGRYAADLARATIDTTPDGCVVEGLVSASSPDELERLQRELPGLTELQKAPLARRELAAAWQLGLPTPLGGGFIHAPSLFAPLRKHSREDATQIVVTVHDLLAWTHPEALSGTTVAWHKSMMKRARKHADAVVVPTHALAEQLGMVADFGDRVRVVPTAPRSGLETGTDGDAERRRDALGLPAEYLVVSGTLEPRKGIVDLLAALGRPGAPEIPLVVIGPESWGEQHLATAAEEAGLDPERVVNLDDPEPADLAAVLAGATAFVAPSHDEGSGTSLIEAFSLGVPVIHSDIPAYAEVSAGAGLAVADDDDFVDALLAAISAVVDGPALAERLVIAGHDRARAFSWTDSAERVWQLHADL